ncbi:MAG TPA: YlbF family regulator [Clostridiaceae bacterium]
MNIYDNAHDLGRALEDNPDIIQFRKAYDKIKGNSTAQNMLKDLRKLQLEAYTQQVETGILSEETKGKLQNFSSVVSINPDLVLYLNAEAKFSVIWEDIMKILNNAIGVDLTLGIK